MKIRILYPTLGLLVFVLFCSNNNKKNDIDIVEDKLNRDGGLELNCPPDALMSYEQDGEKSYVCMEFTPLYNETTRYTYCKVEVKYPEGIECPQGAKFLRREDNRTVCEIPQIYDYVTGWYYLPTLGEGICSEHGDINFPEQFIPPKGSTVFICCKVKN